VPEASDRAEDALPGDTEPPDNGSAALSVLNGTNGLAPAEQGSLLQNGVAALESSGPTKPRAVRSEARRVRRAARAESGKRPSVPRAESDAESEAPTQDASASAALAVATAEPQAEAAVPVINLTGSGKRGARTVRRATKKQQAATAAVEAADDNPALGALNRHLNMMMQQLNTAHRVIGRVVAERDALRQQVAELQGIPVEEIVVSTIGTSTGQPARSSKSPPPSTAEEKSRLARLNYFGGDDVAVIRKRRQKLVLGILGFMVVLWIASRMGLWALPDNLSRDSLGDLPYVGDFMTIFLAGWLFFRVIRVSSKGVKWVFPSEDQRRRRR
jgi:hypothetical protein